ncbi:MAG: response regulator transcription factor [Agathobacter sp.]|mgnify:CR=1 FL=1|nr:response regulator transcription factor [Agathobacter sp.]
MANLLLIDDDKEVLAVNAKYFSQNGFDVKYAENAINGLKILKTWKADCILLDIMMPGMDGFEACKRIRKITNAPIIILSGRTSEDDKVNGLIYGADDYVIKPYSLRELNARIHVQIRRSKEALALKASSNTISYPPITMDLAQHKVYYDDEELSLSNREYELMHILIKKPNTPVTFEEIGNELFGSYVETDRRTIMVTASRLRKKLQEYDEMNELIETVWSKGYLFKTKKS